MAALGTYIVSVSAGAILCGIILAVVPEGGCRNTIRLLCGVFLTLTALSPVKELQLPDWEGYMTAYLQEGEQLAELGQDRASNTLEELIKQQTQSYILDKASRLGFSPDVTVALEEGIPKTAIIQGDYNDQQKSAMERILTEELGIAKECQQWIGRD